MSLEQSFRTYRRLRFSLNTVLLCAIFGFFASSVYFVSRNSADAAAARKPLPPRAQPDFVAIERSRASSKLAALTLAHEEDYADLQMDDLMVRASRVASRVAVDLTRARRSRRRRRRRTSRSLRRRAARRQRTTTRRRSLQRPATTPTTPPPSAAAGDDDPHFTADVAAKQAAVREAFEFAWRNYEEHAFGADEIEPVTGRGVSNWGRLGRNARRRARHVRACVRACALSSALR
jgi:hypothetical protein